MLVIFSHAVRITQTPGSRSFTNTWRPAYCLPKEICPLLPTSFSAAGWAGLRQPWRGSVIVLQQSLWFVWHQLSNGKAELTARYLPLGSDHQCDALLGLAAFAALPQVDQIDEP